MFNIVRNQFRKALNITDFDAYEKLIIGCTTLGTVGGTMYGAMNGRTSRVNIPLNQTIFESILGGFIGTAGGLLIGMTSPVSVPICVFSGVVGLGMYTYNQINPIKIEKPYK